MPDLEEEVAYSPRPFWSGTLTFGLVSIPVDLYSANRSAGGAMRMLGEDGTPLARVFFCPETDREVEPDELARGYEVDKGEFVLISDQELEAVEPEKSRDITLRRFVPLEQLPPAHFRRGYYLAPSGQSTRAYAVLAQTMERNARAGIATFVMRGKEYLVAIVADDGVLRAETLRFADEVRTPDDVGLAHAHEPKPASVKKMKRAIAGLSSDEIPLEPLHDERAEALDALARAKYERGEDVVESALAEEEPERAAEPPDLVAVLKQRLREGGGARGSNLAELHKTQLMKRAKELGIEGRSKMTKAELVRAIERTA